MGITGWIRMPGLSGRIVARVGGVTALGSGYRAIAEELVQLVGRRVALASELLRLVPMCRLG